MSVTDPATAVRKVLFLRDFRVFTGGHLKVWDYFNHVRSSPGHEAWVRWSPHSIWDSTNPWRHSRHRGVPSGVPFDADILLVGGVDWLSLDTAELARRDVPVINLVQHVTHADPSNVRFQFLSRPAIRLCVSEAVATAIAATGQVNGPVYTIPNGVDVGGVTGRETPDVDLLVVANKSPSLGARLQVRLQRAGLRVELVTVARPRAEFLRSLARARVTVFVPNPLEGFYLPALEGMAIGTLVVAADCVGNRSYCHDGVNCFRPERSEDALVAGAEAALAMGQGRRGAMVAAARQTARAHSLGAERASFLEILRDVDRLWKVPTWAM